MASKLYMIRGLPEAGKTTMGSTLSRHNFSSDDFFTGEVGNYNKDMSMTSQSRTWCLGEVTRHLMDQDEDVVVTGTFCSRFGYRHYIKLTEALGSPVIIIDLYDSGLSDEELAARKPGRATQEHIRNMRAIYER